MIEPDLISPVKSSPVYRGARPKAAKIPPRKPAIKSFVVEKRDDPTASWSHVATLPASVNRYTVPDLDEGRGYHFRIYTEGLNIKGTPYEYESPIITTRPAGKYLPGTISVIKYRIHIIMLRYSKYCKKCVIRDLRNQFSYLFLKSFCTCIIR